MSSWFHVLVLVAALITTTWGNEKLRMVYTVNIDYPLVSLESLVPVEQRLP
ncbi:hypothetical protein KC19_2G130300 [Ceratodon purpureus]|uniref:Uncharacterized protein n=1 Tax=Ceratodon purpureus TaxID=3225 RepID=A0A8T0ITB1_CERPU|nr:hypothetical protein KC19_2G130300 [Ceratodon purpureus]